MSEPLVRGRLDAVGVAGAVLCCFLWGGNAVAAKYAIPDLPPIGCGAIRFALGLPVVALVCRSGGQSLWVRPEFLRLLLINGIFSAVQISTFNWGTNYSQAGRSSVFINIHPLVVAPLAWFFLKERLGPLGLLGLASAAFGVAVLLAEPLRRGGGLIGDLVVLGSGVIFGVQTIVQKKTFPFIPPTTLLFAQSIIALVLTAIVSLIFEGPASYHFTKNAILGVAFQGLAVSGLCFATWMSLLRRYPAGRLATIAFLTPIFGVGLGSLMRGEALTVSLLIGGGLVGLGIFLVSADKTTNPLPAPERVEPTTGLPGEDAP